jgi:hypothetical protein
VSAIAANSAFVLSVFAAPSEEAFFGIVIWLSLIFVRLSISRKAFLMMDKYLQVHTHHTLVFLHHTLDARAESVAN